MSFVRKREKDDVEEGVDRESECNSTKPAPPSPPQNSAWSFLNFFESHEGYYPPTLTDIEDDILQQISPMGNTVLHIAALCGRDDWVEEIAVKESHLLAAKNANGDTAMHVAARAWQLSTLKRLLAAVLRNLSHPYFEKPKEALDEILVKNKQGNTFFHVVLLNRHKDVMRILDIPEMLSMDGGFKELVERAALFWTNKENKSVVHLAIEQGYEDIVDDALTRLISQHPALDQFIQNHPELEEMLPHDQGRMKSQKEDNTTMDTTPMAFAKSEMMDNNKLLKEQFSLADWVIMNNFEKPLPKNGNNQDLSQNSDTDSLIENREQPTQLIPNGSHYVPPGQSLLTVAIFKQHKGILEKILTKKKEWIHLRDDKGRTALHYAAAIGYLTGVKCLLENAICCNEKRPDSNHLKRCFSYNMVRDNEGFCALHLASAGGHAGIVKKLLQYCIHPREMLDNYSRNIVHIAAQMGQFNVVRYILQDAKHGLIYMINDKDCDGNTPLHLATLHCHPKIVHALTWDNRVDLTLCNKENQTILDVYMQFPQENPSLRQRLILIALESAGARKYAERGSHSIMVPPHPKGSKNVCQLKSQNKEPLSNEYDMYKDRINTLMLVSTLITTVTFAAGFTLPGGTDSSDPDKGMALMLNQVLFKPFIFSITISMYGAVSATIILIWAQLGDITLTRFALKVAMPLLGITLATLSVAFLAGVHLVISGLNWLATTVMVLCVICILVLSLLYILLWFFSSSSNLVFRYIFYYPFQFLTWLVEKGEIEASSVDSSWSTKREGEAKDGSTI